MHRGERTAVVLAVLCILLTAGVTTAQELSPRAYWPAPAGTGIAIFGYSYATGDVVTDPSLPVQGVDSKIHTGIVGYFQTFGLWGRTANVVFEVPFRRGTTVGDVDGQRMVREFSGLADIGVTLSVNLRGAPSLTPQEFQALRENPRSMLGASLKILAPTGDYDGGRLINIGANRWAVKPELGFLFPLQPKWHVEFEFGVWFFGNNSDFFVDAKREQRPIVAGEIHLVRRFRPGFWASAQFNFFQGGRSTIDGDVKADLQRNSMIGGALVWPFLRRHALKLTASTGVVTGSGGDFTSLLLGYQLRLR